MLRRFAPLVGLVLIFADTARTDDAIPPDTVAAVKHATVFVRVQGPTWKASGSGFVVSTDKDSVLVATNYHVIAPADYDKKPRPGPTELMKSLRAPTVSVVFDSGTKTEVTAKAEVIAADPENDLAVLRITGLKDPPKPIAYADPPKLSETMSVYTFGFPFGQALSTTKGSPAITVGKGSVSSLRMNDDGELAVVQIDGALNPGNSGGPVVDAKGRLVGVAVATIKDSQGIGFAVPCAELGKIMKGRLDGFLVTATKGADGKLTVRAEVGVLDPTAAVKGVTLHYLVVPPKGAKPKAKEPLEKQPGVKKVALKVTSGIATGEVPLDATEGDLYVQAVPEGGLGAAGTTRVQDFSLVLPKTVAGSVTLAPVGSAAPGSGAGEVPAPVGWTEYTATNKTFKVWVPEKSKGQSEKQRTSGTGPNRVTFNAIITEMPNGVTYIVEQVLLPPRSGKQLDRDEIMTILRNVALGDGLGARVTREVDAKMGKFAGKEFLVERGATATRARGFIIGSSIYLLRSIGTRAQVDAVQSTIFLESCRLQVVVRPPVTPGAVIAGGAPIDTEFKDLVPDKGVLVGLELTAAKAGAVTLVKAVRGVFRVGDKETFGEWHGATGPDTEKDVVRAVAKPGYAVGAFNVRGAGIGVYALSITFMKVGDGKLDPKDSYESEWLGGKDGPGVAITNVGGKGEIALALMGKTSTRGASGVGLLYKEVKGPDVVTPPVKGTDKPQIIAGGGAPLFKDVAPAGGLLIGLEFGLGKFGRDDVIKSVRPIYRVGDKEQFGVQRGTPPDRVTTVKAKAGYAIGAFTYKSGLNFDGCSVTFMKGVEGGLDPKDAYESDWVGYVGIKRSASITGGGTPVVGIVGRGSDRELNGLGLLFKGQEDFETNPKPPVAKEPTPVTKEPALLGGFNRNVFKDSATEGGLLVGFEFGLVKSFNVDRIRAARPIYRTTGKETFGEQWGEAPKNAVTVKAKEGYAVGQVTVKHGLAYEGCSVTFMKVVDGKLDPKDKYESEWIGFNENRATTTLGDGTPVIGIVGRTTDKEMIAMGLLFKGQESFNPPPKK